MKPGGLAIMSFSNRMFWTKVRFSVYFEVYLGSIFRLKIDFSEQAIKLWTESNE